MTIPRTAGGRIWFSRDATLTFLLNPGPALVEPSVTNTSDPNYNIYWDFCEFTFNTFELFINVSYVDFISLPIALQLKNTSGVVTTVQGLPSNGLDTVCSKLTAQTSTDGAGWSSLIVKAPSTAANLRALSPNSGIVMNSALFNGYYQPYVQQVWNKYNGNKLQVDTQAEWGTVSGSVDTSTNKLTFGDAGSFAQPSAGDIFSCSTGPFAVGTSELANIAARVSAAFNRSTLLVDSLQPDNEVVSTYYTNSITNHYARILHATNLDGKGYAFPYDDVAPSNGADQSGSLFDSSPQLLTVTVGGPSSAAAKAPHAGHGHAQHQLERRAPGGTPAEGEKKTLAGPSGPAPGESGGGKSGAAAGAEEGQGIQGKQDSLLGSGEKEHPPIPPTKKSNGLVVCETLSSSSSVKISPLTTLRPPPGPTTSRPPGSSPGFLRPTTRKRSRWSSLFSGLSGCF